MCFSSSSSCSHPSVLSSPPPSSCTGKHLLGRESSSLSPVQSAIVGTCCIPYPGPTPTACSLLCGWGRGPLPSKHHPRRAGWDGLAESSPPGSSQARTDDRLLPDCLTQGVTQQVLRARHQQRHHLRPTGLGRPCGPQSAGPTWGLSLRSLPPAGGQWYYSQGCPPRPLGTTQAPPPVPHLPPKHRRTQSVPLS